MTMSKDAALRAAKQLLREVREGVGKDRQDQRRRDSGEQTVSGTSMLAERHLFQMFHPEADRAG